MNDLLKPVSPLHSVEAEQQILGILLLDNTHLDKIIDFLKPHHFFRAVHGKVFEEIIRLNSNDQVADPVSLNHLFQQNPELVAVGGAQYLLDLVDSVISVYGLKDYAQVVVDLSLRRDFAEIGHEIIREAHNLDSGKTPREQITAAEHRLYELSKAGKSGSDVLKFPESAESFFKDADRAYAKEEGIVGLSTGIRPLDGGLGGGLKSPDLLILAARPSMGKTALATNIAFNVARAGTPVIFFSLEMSAAQLAGRIICGEAYLPLQRVYRGELHAKEFEHLHKIGGSLLDTPLFIDETPSLNIVTLRNRARHLKRLYGIGLVVVDYLQLLETEARRGYISNRVQEISDISKSLKGLAKELDLPVLALSQLSRNVEQRDSKQPQLSDLRDSGSIEQDADVVMFVYREEYYLQNRKPEYGTVDFENWQIKADAASGKAEVIVAKNRNGSTGKVDLFFDKGIMRFREPINHENIT